MFPIWLQPFIKCSPIFVITYGPAKLIIDFSMEMFLSVVFAQVIYIVIVVSILTVLYQKGVKRLNVNGG
jgi:ABC-2 type transport system permease protein